MNTLTRMKPYYFVHIPRHCSKIALNCSRATSQQFLNSVRIHYQSGKIHFFMSTKKATIIFKKLNRKRWIFIIIPKHWPGNVFGMEKYFIVCKTLVSHGRKNLSGPFSDLIRASTDDYPPHGRIQALVYEVRSLRPELTHWPEHIWKRIWVYQWIFWIQ